MVTKQDIIFGKIWNSGRKTDTPSLRNETGLELHILRDRLNNLKKRNLIKFERVKNKNGDFPTYYNEIYIIDSEKNKLRIEKIIQKLREAEL